MRVWFLLVLLFPVWQAIAAPVVIFDAGNTQSMAPYYAAILPQQQSAHSPAKHKRKHTTWQRPADDFFLPLRTPELTPGSVTPRAVKRAPRRPFFVLGSDRFSRQWLTEYHDQLVEMGAIGLLVQVETLEDVQIIRQLGYDLTILPVSGTYLAEKVGLRHYPALISREGIEQ